MSLASSIALVKNLSERNFKINKHFAQPGFLQDNQLLFEQVPTTVFVTHHKEVFKHALISENYIIRFLTMEVVIQNKDNFYSFVKEEKPLSKKGASHYFVNMKEGLKFESLDERDKVLFMYKTKPGFSVNSFAILCAKQAGFSSNLLSRINEIQNRLHTMVPKTSILEEKYNNTTKDCLYKINDLLYSLKNIT